MQKITTNSKRALSLMLTLCLVLSLMPVLSVPARAESASATVGNVTISGDVGVSLWGIPVTITLLNDTINSELAVDDSAIAGMIQDLPAGVTVVAESVISSGATSITLIVDGEPEAKKSGPLSIIIPGSILTGGQSITVTENAKVAKENGYTDTKH